MGWAGQGRAGQGRAGQGRAGQGRAGHGCHSDTGVCERQARGRLGNALPIVIEGGENWEEAAEELDSMFLGDAEVWYAPAQVARLHSRLAGQCSC